MTKKRLQNEFMKATGIECVNSQGEPDIDYVQWLEQKIIDLQSATPALPLQEFIEEVERMQELYKNYRFTSAELLRDNLAAKLDDLMRQ